MSFCDVAILAETNLARRGRTSNAVGDEGWVETLESAAPGDHIVIQTTAIQRHQDTGVCKAPPMRPETDGSLEKRAEA